jgi:beta-lactamase regulating signal transducer with metallopeptidase domain
VNGELSGFLLNALEASVLAGAVLFFARLWKLAPPVRHLLWLMVVVKLLLPPFPFSSLGLSGLCARAVEGLVPSSERAASPGATLPPVEPSLAALELAVAPEPSTLLGEEAAATSAAPTAGEEARPPRSFLRILLGLWPFVWLAGALALGIRQVASVVGLEKRLRLAEPAGPEVEAQCRAVSAALGLRRPPEVRVLRGPVPPMVWALGRPVVVLPAELAGASREVVQSLLAHELAHLKRLDHWWCWIELLGGWGYWWLPTFWLSRREMRRAADEACDGWAVSVLASRSLYAESLLATLELVSARGLGVPAMGRGLGAREAVQRRLTMIMREPLRHRMTRQGWLGLALAGVLALPAAPERLKAQSPPPLPPSQPAPAAVPATPAAPAALPPQAQPGAAGTPATDPLPVPIGSSGRAGSGLPKPKNGRSHGKGPAPAAEAAEPANPEDRLQALESKMERILAELEALRGGGSAPGVGLPTTELRMESGARTARIARRTATITAPAAPGAVGVGQPPPPGGVVVYEGRAGINGGLPRGGVVLARPAAPVAVEAAPSVSRFVRNLNLSPEKREEVEKLQAKYHDMREALRKEEREAIREALKDVVPADELKQIEGEAPSTGPIEFGTPPRK